MKNNYKQLLNIMVIMLIGFIGFSQNIKLSIKNAQNTNDGSFDYYEADIMIQTIDGQADFKLGSGQLYLNYNTSAFGFNIYSIMSADNRFEVTADYASGYFLGEKSGFTSFYNISSGANNTDSRVSWDFSQGVSSGAMTETVGNIPKLLIHIKFRYMDINQNPLVVFETDEAQVIDARDQFFTACGPYDSPDTDLDCSDKTSALNVNNQFFDATFDSTESVLSIRGLNNLVEFSISPNPTQGLVYIDINKKRDYLVFDMLGKQIKEGSFNSGINELQLKDYEGGVYFLKVIDDFRIYTKRIVLE